MISRKIAQGGRGSPGGWGAVAGCQIGAVRTLLAQRGTASGRLLRADGSHLKNWCHSARGSPEASNFARVEPFAGTAERSGGDFGGLDGLGGMVLFMAEAGPPECLLFICQIAS